MPEPTSKPISINNPSEFQAAYEAGLKAISQAPRPARAKEFVVVPEGFEVVDLTEIADAKKLPPIKYKPRFATVQSFCDYFNTYRAGSASVIFANPQSRQFTGVLDYVGESPETSMYGEHQATFSIALSADFQKWKESNTKKFNQEEFALFIEEQAPAFVNPNAATMREIATELHLDGDIKFSAGVRTQDGQVRFSYVEDLQGRAGKTGEIQIPVMFEIAIPIFYGGKVEQLKAWFRYRLTGGKLTLWYELYRADEAVDNAFNAAVLDVQTITATKVWLGQFA